MKHSAAVGSHRLKQMALTEPTETEQCQMLYEADFDVYLLRARLVHVLIPSALAWPSVPDCECWHSGEHLTLSCSFCLLPHVLQASDFLSLNHMDGFITAHLKMNDY